MMAAAKQLLKAILSLRLARRVLLMLHMPIAWVVIRSYGLFDDDWYRLQYGGHRHELFKNKTPLIHYLYVGRFVGLTPSPFFVAEYYDHRRWNHAIIDPLLKYSVQPSNWSRPTSVLFDPIRFAETSGFRPPLSIYLSRLRKDNEVAVYDTLGKKRRWREIKSELYGYTSERRNQFELKKIADPISRFDHRRETATVEKYQKYFDNIESPLISVIMPAWNREELIRPAIESVQAQTYENWELIIVDDGSTDTTVEVVRTYAANDSRIKLFTPGHGGVCKARNHGISNAKGEWVAFLDSDNSWRSNFLHTAIAMLDESGMHVGYGAMKMNKAGSVRYRATAPNPKLLETGNYVDLNALVVSRGVLKRINGFDESLRRMVDYDLVIRLSKVETFIYIPVLAVEYTDHEDVSRITTTESVSWDGVVKSRNFIDWKMASDRKTDGVSIVLPVREESLAIATCLDSILRNSGIDKLDIVVADASANSAASVTAGAVAALDDRVRYSRFAASNDTVLAANYGFAQTKYDKAVFIDQHVTAESGWLEPLVSILDSNTLVGSLQLNPSQTVRSAGVEFYGENAYPVDILKDHPTSDTRPLDDVYEVDGLPGGVLAAQAEVFSRLHGLNPLYDKGFAVEDISLRARDAGYVAKIAKLSRVVNSSTADEHFGDALNQYTDDWRGKTKSRRSGIWQQAGLKVIKYETVPPSESSLSIVRPLLEIAEKSAGQYRWAIKISSPCDERRHIWGDTHFAEALAKALEKQGQRVAIDYHNHHGRPTSYLDDVVLDLRGLDDTQPQPDALNIMWVISHPEKVTQEIVNKFDLVFAAGKKWAEFMTEKSGKNIEYLPQCTDPEVFHPTESDPQFEDRVLFVGSSRNVLRPIVRDAIAAGIDLDVYGGGWHGLIDEKYIKGEFIPNSMLTNAYSSAALVLNDHWEDMREWGFISNRIFDALATGTYVATDDVDGLGDTIKTEMLRVVKTSGDLQQIVTGTQQPENFSEVYRYIAANHSFDARAHKLISSIEKYENEATN